MTERRRYTKREKAVAVTAALASSVKAAAESQGIPRKTVEYWVESPEFATLRQKTREDLAKGFELLAHRAQAELMDKIPEMEPRDLTVLLGVATDKSQLLSGHATERLEHRELDEFSDHETRELVEGARRYLAGAGSEEGTPLAESAAVEGAGS